MCVADAVVSTSEPTVVCEAEHNADSGDSPGPGDTAEAPRDCCTLDKQSKKKRLSAENGSCACVEEYNQQSKRQKARSQSQTDKAAGQARNEENTQEQKLRGQSSCDDEQHTEDRQHSGQHSGQHNRQHKTHGQSNVQWNGQNKGDGHSSRHHNGQPKYNGQSSGQAEATNSRQLRNSRISPEHVSNIGPESEPEPASDSSPGKGLEDEEEGEAADMELGSLGNVDIATASQVLSLSMLQGLKAGLQARLSLYAISTIAEDLQQLKEVQEANARWESHLSCPCPALPCPALPCPALPCPATYLSVLCCICRLLPARGLGAAASRVSPPFSFLPSPSPLPPVCYVDRAIASVQSAT